MFKPKVHFIFGDPETEAEHLCFLAKNITDKRYQKGGYLVVPYLATNNSHSVFFPDLPYSREFWLLIQKNKNEDYGKQFPQKAADEASRYLKNEKYTRDEKSRKDKLISDWKKGESLLFKFVNEHFDKKPRLSQIEMISILITKYGTQGSFNVIHPSKKIKEIVATFRIDSETSHLAKTILKAIYIYQTNKHGEIGEIPFYERIAAIKCLYQNSPLSKIFPESNTEKDSYFLSEKLRKDSKDFLTKLGFPPEQLLSLKNEKIHLEGQNIDCTFSQQEKDLLVGIISKNGELLSFDEASEAVWKEQSFEKFSLFSLAKIIENLRRKLRQLGLYSQIIKTIRNRGYLLQS